MADDDTLSMEQFDDTDWCFICDEPVFRSPVKNRFKKHELKKLTEASRRRKDGKHRLVSGIQELPIHGHCYRTYCSEADIQAAIEDLTDEEEVEERPESPEPKYFDFHVLCFFCADSALTKYTKNRRDIRKSHTITPVTKLSVMKKIIKEVEEYCKIHGSPKNDEVLERLRDDPMIINRKPRYHNHCYRRFFLPPDYPWRC